jgi:hypothetical protein
MSKKIGELSLEEAKEAIVEVNFKKRAIQLRIKAYKNGKSLKALEKKAIKDEKTRKLKSLQNEINAAATKSVKDQKSKNKITQTKSFDNRIATKDREIEKIKGDILANEKEILSLDKVISALKLHMKTISQ